uniref:Uncharacterized protein n=1 Tax=Pectinophora gossypiella TaxID=13191 RepID=A0A1E1WGT2_PECGO
MDQPVDNSDPEHYGDANQAGPSAAPEGEQNRTSSDTDSSSSSSEDEESIVSPPPNKRPKRKSTKHVTTCSDPRVETLINHVSCLSEYVSQIPQYLQSLNTNTNVDNIAQPGPSSFLQNPCLPVSNCVSLGELGLEFDQRNIVPLANKDRLEELKRLQQFDSPAWKNIRYKKALQTLSATPGFVGLKVNEEFCHFNKNKDYLASTENLLAGLSNAVLQQRELLKTGSQNLVDWASANPKDLNPNSLFEKVSSTFGPGSPSYNMSETTMQIICGKRSECIEVRRDRIVKEIKNPNVKTTLMNIPPSAEHLFSRGSLLPLINSLGGVQSWLNTPNYLKEKRFSEQHTNKKVQKQPSKFNKTEQKRQTHNNKKNHTFRRNSGTDSNAKSK